MGPQTLAIKHHVNLAKSCVDEVLTQINAAGVVQSNYEKLWATLARAIGYLRSTDEEFARIDSKAKGMG